ncbi:hypothetical protein Nepgr_030684 [Nepenthes gracilis]|uniref:Uncharacterized protein n=1 Tax=Nepenthes gracilis TaxID=150966 RepID=A0AAD3TGQ7_NEPGR|nr:hypothetical protein Nepgr_030684 [Nepenthes gracilis]
MLKLCGNGVKSTLPLYFRYCLPYSTSTTERASHCMEIYLVNSLGFSREEAASASTKVRHFKSTEAANSVINFFKRAGLDKAQIKNLITLVPKLLNCKVDKTLKPKIRIFQDLGLSNIEVVDLIAGNPTVLTRGLDTHIAPSIKLLKSILGTDETVVKVFKRSPWLLSCNLPKRMQPNVVLLQSYGLSSERIQNLVVQRPRFLAQDSKWIEGVLARVEEKLRIPRDASMFLSGVYLVSSLSEKSLESKYQVFKSFGWTESEVTTMVSKLPFSLKLSEATISSRLNFFMNELDYEPGYLASHPRILMYSLEKRVLPRNSVLQALKERKLIKTKTSLYVVVGLKESQFFTEFVLPYKDELPQIYESYINNKTGIC